MMSNTDMTREREARILERAIRTFGTRAQILVAVEEMAELQQALLKLIRCEDFGQGTKEDALRAVSGERADVSIMLNQLDLIFGDNTDTEIAKLERLEKLVGSTMQEAPHED